MLRTCCGYVATSVPKGTLVKHVKFLACTVNFYSKMSKTTAGDITLVRDDKDRK